MAVLKKSDAENIAEKMTGKLLDEIDLKKNTISDIVKAEYLGTVPDQVRELFKTHSKWIESGKYIYFEGVGLKSSCATLSEYVPQYNQTRIILSEESAVKVAKLQDEIIDLQRKHKRLYKNTLEILLNLKTYKKIEDQFPAAAEYLPNLSDPLVPMLPIKDVMAELNELNNTYGQTAGN